MKVLAITQARYGSTRLPAKVLKYIGNETLLYIHLKRILKAKNVSKLMVATTYEEGAEKIVEIAKRAGVETYKGSVNDVLERFYFATKPENPDYVVRITSDCPLIDPAVIDQVVEKCISSGVDYVSNTMKPTYPDGIDCECFKFSALEKAFNEAIMQSEREHVTPYIKKNSSFNGGNLFKSINYEYPEDYSAYRITVDTARDFEVIRFLIDHLGTDKSWLDYIKFLDSNNEIKNINCFIGRDEGYQKSLREDKKVK